MIRNCTWYKAKGTNGNSELCLFGLAPKFFDETVEKIQEVVDHVKTQGYNNDEKWLIVRVDSMVEHGDDGTFKCSVVRETTEGIYDNGNVARF